MKTIQMTIDEPLLAEVDRLIVALNTTRSAFIRDALQATLRRYTVAALEEQHEQGYARHPVEPGEFDVRATEQAWGDGMNQGEIRWYTFSSPHPDPRFGNPVPHGGHSRSHYFHD